MELELERAGSRDANSEASLELQQEELKIIQGQQRRRFMLRNEKPSSPTSTREGYGAEINLGLETTTQCSQRSSGKHQAASEIDYKQISESLQLENADIKRKLTAMSQEVVGLRKFKDEADVSELGSNATHKIINLSKKNRELSAMITAERNRAHQLAKHLKATEEALKAKETTRDAPDHGRDIEHKAKILKHQLEQCNMKLVECRSENQVINNELKVAHKIIASEVGDDVDLNSLVSGTSSWRGRAQRIIHLQNKLKETKRKLAVSEKGKRGVGTLECRDVRQKETLTKLDQDKKMKLHECQSEIQSLREEYSKLQYQYNALKARNKTLTANLKAARLSDVSPVLKYDITPASLMSCSNSSAQDFSGQAHFQRERHEWEKEKIQLQQHITKLLSDLSKLRQLDCGPVSTLASPLSSEGNHSQLETLLKVTKTERDGLLKLSESMQQRLDAATNKIVRLDTDLRNQKERSRNLQKRLKCDQIADVKTELSESKTILLLNENTVLKETLELTRHEKLEDITLLNAMVQDVKQMFIETLANTPKK